MLNARTPFPQIGSYALLEEGETHLVRLQYAVADGIKIAFPLRPGASGFRTVQLSDLVNGDELASAERVELRHLEQTAGKTGKRRARLEELRLRDIRSTVMNRLIARLPRQVREAA